MNTMLCWKCGCEWDNVVPERICRDCASTQVTASNDRPEVTCAPTFVLPAAAK
jgi:hypothetical protein